MTTDIAGLVAELRAGVQTDGYVWEIKEADNLMLRAADALEQLQTLTKSNQ
jgi:hypothetical protein